MLLAVLFGIWSLRGVNGSSIADYDSPRHALNGAFILDLFRHGKLLHPVHFGYWYYSRLPALSLPYHPPVFPAIEALAFALFGVSSFVARFTVAVATAVAVLLLIRLIRATHGSRLLAFVVTASFFALPSVQQLSKTVMLEIPALVFVLAAFWFLLPEDRIFSAPRSLWFGILGALAIWTKQTVFLLPLPFLYVFLSRRWNLLPRRYLWMDSLILTASSIWLLVLAQELHWNGINRSWTKESVLQQFADNSNYYLHHGLWVIVLMAITLLTYRLPGGDQDFRNDRLYLTWLLAAVMIVLTSPAYSARYLFFAIPPVLVLFFNAVYRISRSLSAHSAWIVPAVICLVWVSYGFAKSHPIYLRGPDEAAKVLFDGGYRRILYCGNANGAFIFGVRSNDSSLATIVIRGDKLPLQTFDSGQLEEFVKLYGIDAVVLEESAKAQPWDSLENLSFWSLLRVLPVSDSEGEMSGSLFIYGINNPTTVPESSLQIPISVLGRDVIVQF